MSKRPKCQSIKNVPSGCPPGITAAEIIGSSKNRATTAARVEFCVRAHKEGISASFLARMTGRTHVAVIKALKKAAL